MPTTRSTLSDSVTEQPLLRDRDKEEGAVEEKARDNEVEEREDNGEDVLYLE